MLSPQRKRAILVRHAKGQAVGRIASDLRISRDTVRAVIAESDSEPLETPSEMIPGVSQFSYRDAQIAKQPRNDAEEAYITEKVWAKAAELREAAVERMRRQVYA